jgi:hypothetical protein
MMFDKLLIRYIYPQAPSEGSFLYLHSSKVEPVTSIFMMSDKLLISYIYPQIPSEGSFLYLHSSKVEPATIFVLMSDKLLISYYIHHHDRCALKKVLPPFQITYSSKMN